MSTRAQSRIGSIATSGLLFVVVSVALFFLYRSFGWPVWQGVVVAVLVGLLAAGANYLAARHRKLGSRR